MKKRLTKMQALNYTFFALAGIQFFGAFALLLLFIANPSFGINGFDTIATALGMATLYSIFLVTVAWFVYGLYKNDALFIGLFLLIFFVAMILVTLFGSGIDPILYILSGKWMGIIHKIVFCLIAVGCCSTAMILLYHSENNPKKERNEKKVRDNRKIQYEALVDETNRYREMRKKGISQNAIEVSVTKRGWNFSASEYAHFGYDVISDEYVFVNENDCREIKQDQIISLGYESSDNHQLDGKLFYLGSGGTETAVSFTVHCNENIDETCNRIQRLRDYFDNTLSRKEYAVFRRKIRESTLRLDKNYYPNRPYHNKNWFSQLEESLCKYHNSDGTAYDFFKSRVISCENCSTDNLIWGIICNLSKETPDYTEIKKAAKQLCHKSLFDILLK